MSFLISSAYAVPTTNAAAAGPSPIGQILMMVGFAALFYFLIWRPQAKRTKEHRALIDSVAVGSEVIFAGGLMGRIVKLQDDYAVIALNATSQIKVQKASVISVLPPGTLDQL